MEPVYRIAKWGEVYENHESRKLKSITWIAFPVDLDSNGFISLVETFGEDAPTIYGAWTALVCVAARCPSRGVLLQSSGQPLTVPRIATKARFPSSVMQRMWDWALSIGWIEPCDTSGESPGNLPERREILPDERDDTERPDMELPNNERPDERGAGVRADVREDAGGKVVVSAGDYRSMMPTMERIARIVTRDNSVTEAKLRGTDRELCAVAAVLAHQKFGVDWVSSILRSISARKTPADNPWGHFRGCLIKACERKGLNFHDFEQSVSLPAAVVAKRLTLVPQTPNA
jgi:hypothetical protein